MERSNVHLLFRLIEELSKVTGQSELEVFKNEAMKALVQISDSGGNFRYKSILEKKLKLAIKEDLVILQESNYAKSQQLSHVLQISKAIDEWKGKNVNSRIKSMVKDLKDLQINSMVNWMNKTGSKTNIDEITELSNQIIELLKNRDSNVHDDHVG